MRARSCGLRHHHAQGLSLTPAGRALPPVRVTHVKVGMDSISFHVDRTGVPVTVAKK